jgi:hypothetical protein
MNHFVDLRLAQLYKRLISEAQRFPQYNFRDHALRRIERVFGPKATSEMPVEDVLKKGEEEIHSIKRMTAVSSLYVTGRKSSVEDQDPQKPLDSTEEK